MFEFDPETDVFIDEGNPPRQPRHLSNRSTPSHRFATLYTAEEHDVNRSTPKGVQSRVHGNIGQRNPHELYAYGLDGVFDVSSHQLQEDIETKVVSSFVF